MLAASNSSTGAIKYSVDELTYKRIGTRGNGYIVDAYKGDRLLMTYTAYYNHKTSEFTLYPSKCHRLDSRIPGKHTIPVIKMK